MRVGLDFDGVIADPNRLKAMAAREWHGFSFPARMFKKKHVVAKGLMSEKEYDAFNLTVCRHVKLARQMPPVRGAVEGIRKLQRAGNDVSIISSRSGKAVEIARDWLERHDVRVSFKGTGTDDKTVFCRGLDAYVDDDLAKLKPLEKTVPKLYLLSHAYNAHEVLENGTRRVKSWNKLVQELTQPESFTL